MNGIVMLISGRVNNHVDGLGRAIDELYAVAAQFGHVGLRLNAAVPHKIKHLRIDDRMRFQKFVVGRRQPVIFWPTDGSENQHAK